jgi:hypothetical protein
MAAPAWKQQGLIRLQALGEVMAMPIAQSSQAQTQVEQLVERTLDLHKKLVAAAIPADKELCQRQIEATDHQIDALVYELYGLTGEEVAIVESAARP